MKLQIIIDDVVGEPVTLDGPGIFPYARAITGFSGAEVSLRPRTRTRRRA